MARNISNGRQNFERLVAGNNFYVDKTEFIKQWWKKDTDVTLITRPRRFGKTLVLSMVERFFSIQYKGKPELFENLAIGKDEDMMKLQGTFPVISLSLAGITSPSYGEMIKSLSKVIRNVFKNVSRKYGYDNMDPEDVEYLRRLLNMRYDENNEPIPLSENTMIDSLSMLSSILSYKFDGKNVIILLDEYDAPLENAYLCGYWGKASEFFGQFYKNTFKVNDCLSRALITGINMIPKESLSSPFNNPAICSVTFPLYEEAFGFTQKEVDDALAEYGMSGHRDEVKRWYDGYQFGNKAGMYNPWSISNYLLYGVVDDYWANSASNGIVSHVVKNGSIDLKDKFIGLLQGQPIVAYVNEDTTYMSLLAREDTVWGLLLACGYLKCLKREGKQYTLAIVNHEVMEMMDGIVHAWFRTEKDQRSYDSFVKALLVLDEGRMNASLSALAKEIFGLMDTSGHEGEHDPEGFYHGFVLGLVASLRDRYVIESNKESGYGRYDIMLIPLDKDDNGIILEFKVFNKEKEDSLEGTCTRALQQIEEKQYDVELRKHGVPEEKIHKFGIGFKGKETLVKKYTGKESLAMPAKKPRKPRAKRNKTLKKKRA